MATSIARVPVVETEDLRNSTQLFEKSSQLLGYKAEHVSVYGQLSKVLAQLGIQPLNRGQVEAYKASKEYKSMRSDTKFLIWATSILCLLVTAAGYGIFTYLLGFGDRIVSSVLTLVVGAAVYGVIRIAYHEMDSRHVIREWRVRSLTDYAHRVPEFALSKAVEIKQALPGANFSVEELVSTNHHEIKRLPDPFLIVSHGKEAYYIDVWDETEFERGIK